jgi:hypothetical protein
MGLDSWSPPALRVKSLPADRLLASYRFKIGGRIRSTGFWVGWSYFVSSDPPMMNFGDAEFQMVEFPPAFPYHGAFFFCTNQHGSCWNQLSVKRFFQHFPGSFAAAEDQTVDAYLFCVSPFLQAGWTGDPGLARPAIVRRAGPKAHRAIAGLSPGASGGAWLARRRRPLGTTSARRMLSP